MLELDVSQSGDTKIRSAYRTRLRECLEMKSANYFDTFITVSGDCPARMGKAPQKIDSIAGLQYKILMDRPYLFTSDDLLFEVFVQRNAISDTDRASARNTFFSKPQACLRASPLVKQFGWGLHHDGVGRLAAYGVETEDYRKLAARADLKVLAGMRNRRR
jgi:hypothetical protein